MSIAAKLKKLFFVTLRVRKYKMLSSCKRVDGKPRLHHPLLLKGDGKIIFGRNVQVGVTGSPYYYSHYSYIEARGENSAIILGDNVSINNNFSAVALKKITIGNNVLIGVNCSILDSDSHFLDPGKRNMANPPAKEVHIMENVFLGSNVTILKGVTIGKNSVIGNSSVVTKSIPENTIAAGNPARVIKSLVQ